MRTSRAWPIIAILAAGLLFGSATGVAAQDDADAARQLVAEEVEPGVERIISDGAGHDLDETHPNNRYDMDGIAIAPDGTVWLTTTYNGSDNRAGVGAIIWAIGQPGTLVHGEDLPDLIVADGTLLAVGEEVLRVDGERLVPDDGPMLRQMADGGLLLRIDAADLVGQLPEGEAGSIRDLYAVWGPHWDGWTMLGEFRFFGESRFGEVWAGDYWCWLGEDAGWGHGGDGVSCQRGEEGGMRSGEPTTYLADTEINQIAAAPDGSIWAVGGYRGRNGGLYRITPELPAE